MRGMPESPQNLRALVVGSCGCLVEEWHVRVDRFIDYHSLGIGVAVG